MRQEAATKREEIKRMEEEAEHRRVMPVDDSKIVEQMFGFLPEGEQPTGDIEAGVCGVRTYMYTCTVAGAQPFTVGPLESELLQDVH